MKTGTPLAPILFGAKETLFPGTRPTALIHAFATAVASFPRNKTHRFKVFEIFRNAFASLEDTVINSPHPSHIFSVSIGGIALDDLLAALEGKLSFSSGCACSGTESPPMERPPAERPPTLRAIDPQQKRPPCTIRLSFADTLSLEEAKKAARLLVSTIQHLRKTKPAPKGCPAAPKPKNTHLSPQQKLQHLLREAQ